ncbi:MAG: hypothetical protein GX557_07490, partial [Chloroflexi bacterium]|nr:hypothetical protein [Chloroflexota bacterium]
QNQSETETAHITVNFYWAEGTALAGQVAHTFTDEIAPGKSVSYYVPTNSKTAGLPADFVGSAVVSSDQPVAANLNTQLPSDLGADPNNPMRMGTASGVLEPAGKLFFTQVMKAYWGWDSYIAVQNTGSDTANVTVRYYNDSNGAQVTTESAAIHPYSTKIFRQSEVAGLPTNWAGSAVVEAADSKPLAGVANFFADGTPYADAMFQSYNAAAAGATKLYVPRVVKDYWGYQGGLKIQNVGTAPTDVTITYRFGANSYTQTIENLGPNQAKGLYMGTPSQVPALAGVVGSGSAVIESSGQPIIATANEDNRTEGFGVTYNAIPDGGQTNAVLFPQITAKYYGFCGGVQVQNVGGSDATVTAVFSMQGRTDVTVSASVPSMGSVSWFAPSVVGADFNGSVVVSAAQPLVGIGNGSYRSDVDNRYGVKYGDSFTTYNGINK